MLTKVLLCFFYLKSSYNLLANHHCSNLTSFLSNTQLYRNNILVSLFFILFSCTPNFLFAQSNTQTLNNVTGKVVDSNGEPVPGVFVNIKGSTNGTTTNTSGIYSINVAGSKSILIFSFLGFETQEVSSENKSIINITLKESSTKLDEIVVVGYGTVKRKDLTGAVGTVDMEDLNKAPVRNIDEALGGRVAGVQVTSTDGQPGSPVSIVIRGGNSLSASNSPLYVIDGFPIEDYDNNLLSPNSIESIDVLKDAAATAIYGSRAANGVIVITTKKGKEGPPVVSYDSFYGLQTRLKEIELLSTSEFINLQRETLSSGQFTSTYLTPLNRKVEDYQNIKSINWQDEITRTAPMASNFLSISGGSKTSKYFISGNITNQQGIIVASGYRRYNGRIKLDQTINDKLVIGIDAAYSDVLQKGTRVGATYGAASRSLMYGAWGFRPVAGSDIDLLDAFNDPDLPSNNQIVNPLQSAINEFREMNMGNIVTNVYFDYSLSDKIKFKSTAGINNRQQQFNNFNNALTSTGNPLSTSGLGINGEIFNITNNNWSNENTLTYKNKFSANHNFDALLGATAQGNKVRNSRFGANQIQNDQLLLNSLDEGDPATVESGSSLFTLASFLGRVNYSYKNKYLLTASFRADGSSRFAKGSRWGYFPAGAFAWKLIEENFIKNISFISDAKIRLSYGVTGNNRVLSDFPYSSQILSNRNFQYPFNNSLTNSGAARTLVGNPDITWEKTASSDLGIDLGFFKNRILLTTDFYIKNTSDLLLNTILPKSTGYTNAFNNVGKVRNTGIEFSLNTVNLKSKNFNWKSNFNISFNKSEVTQLADNQQSFTSTIRWEGVYNGLTPYITKIGQPISTFYGLIFDGVYQYGDFNVLSGNNYFLKDEVSDNGNARLNIKPGDIKYRDLNGDGTIDSKDYTIIGNALPKHVGGFSNNFNFKNFDLNVFFQWSYGNEIINSNRYLFESGYVANLNQFATYADRWSPTNQSSNIPRYSPPTAFAYSSRVVEDGSYLRLKTVNLGYTIPNTLTKKISVNKLRMYVAVQNLLTWTEYTGLDPEVSVRNSGITQGFDYSSYPQSRTVTFGLRATL